jgi:hypothetical protein
MSLIRAAVSVHVYGACQDLERLLYEEESNIDMHVACDAVFSVKLLLALESKYDIYLDSLYNSDSK